MDPGSGLVATPASTVAPFLKRGPMGEFLPELIEGAVLQILSHIDMDNNVEHWHNAKLVNLREIQGKERRKGRNEK